MDERPHDRPGAVLGRETRAAPPAWDPWWTAQVAWDVQWAPWSGAAGIEARQRERLAALLRATRRAPWFRRHCRGCDAPGVRLHELPVTDKRTLMQRFDEHVGDPALHRCELQRFVADAARIGDSWLGRYTVWESSGSSGEPGLFVQDPRAMAVYDALETLRRPLLRPWRRVADPWGVGERIVFVGATGGHYASAVSFARLRALNPLLAPALRSVSFVQPLPHLLAEVQALAPTVVASYPTMAVLLAEAQSAGRLAIAPQEVWTGGETLTTAMRAAVEAAFGCAVVDSYGASEFLALASACRHGHLHLNSDWAILESVDDKYRPVPAGQGGATTLLTNLANHVQPLIRYDLGDRVTIHAQPCACGSALPVIEVQGRSDDLLHLTVPGRRPQALAPLALCTVLEEQAGLFDFEIEQQGPAHLLLRCALAGAGGERALARGRAALRAYLDAQGLEAVRIEGRSAAPAQRGRSGKLQRVRALRVGCLE